MLFFRSEEHVDSWCKQNQVPRRPIVSIDQLWQLALNWYENRLRTDSQRPASDEIISIFDRIGLSGPFWDPFTDKWR